MANIKLASKDNEVTVFNIEIEKQNLAPALVALGFGVLVYSLLKD